MYPEYTRALYDSASEEFNEAMNKWDLLYKPVGCCRLNTQEGSPGTEADAATPLTMIELFLITQPKLSLALEGNGANLCSSLITRSLGVKPRLASSLGRCLLSCSAVSVS